MNDSIIGTLGIYYTHKDDGLYPNGASRDLSRDLTDLVQSQIVSDIQALYEPEWSRRGMWDKAYFEAHVPEVPAMLLELLSHQNFADMRYGLDPRFRFTVSRAIYKGILRFLAFQYKQDCVIQPLPVDHFRIAFAGRDSVELNCSRSPTRWNRPPRQDDTCSTPGSATAASTTGCRSRKTVSGCTSSPAKYTVTK